MERPQHPNSSWQDAFYLSSDDQLDASDLLLGRRTRFGSLDIDEFYEETASFTLPNGLSGDFFVFVQTDEPNDVFELDKNNNIGFDAEEITIVSRPADLVVTAASSDATAEAGKGIRVDWTVANQGVGDTVVSSWTDRIIASVDGVLGNGDDVSLGEFTRSGLLNVGEGYSRSEIVSIPFNFAGDYQLFVVTDARGQVFEDLNEGNNASTALPIFVNREAPIYKLPRSIYPRRLKMLPLFP